MAHFAEIDKTNVVIRIVVVANQEILDDSNNEVEEKGQQFCQKLFGNGMWVQTSYSGKFRKRFASVGFKYDAVNDVFIPPQIFSSWNLNTTTFDWEPPIPKPADAISNGGNVRYQWNEETINWIKVS